MKTTSTAHNIPGHEVFLVGGAVRDHLLGVDSKDMDWVVVGSTPQKMLDAGFKQVGADFPVFLCPETGDEFALARTERKTDVGYNGFACEFGTSVTLEDDLLRRDLTINAMAMTADGVLIDPFGGQDDLNAGILRHVSPAFAEDPVRVLRTARFAARLGFQIAVDTLILMRSLANEMETLTAERVWQETSKALSEDTPTRFFEELHNVNALDKIFPELSALRGVDQPAQHHPEVDTFVHVMLCLEQAVKLDAPNDVRFAVLLHDLGKGVTPEDELPQHRGHESAGVPLVKAVCDRLKVPKAHRVLALAACEHHLRCHRMREMRAGSVLKLLKALDGFRKPEQVDKFAMVCEADARGRTGLEDREYTEADMLRGALVVAKAVSAKPLAERGLTGVHLGEVLDQERIMALKSFLK